MKIKKRDIVVMSMETTTKILQTLSPINNNNNHVIKTIKLETLDTMESSVTMEPLDLLAV